MICTDKDIYNIINFCVLKNMVVYNKDAEDGELTPRLLALLRKVFKENYFKQPTHLLIDKEYETDINFVADQIVFIPQTTDCRIIRILGYEIDYIDDLQKIAKEYVKFHEDVRLNVYEKRKIIIVKNEENSLIGVY